MSGNDAEHLTPEERADIFRRLQEMELQKKMKPPFSMILVMSWLRIN